VPGQVGRILTRIWGQRSGYVFLPVKHTDGRWDERGAFPWFGQLEALSVPQGANAYFCPLVFEYARRLSEYALPTQVLWSDLDEADPSKIALPPSIAWKTTQGAPGGPSNHWQALWLLDRPVTPQAAAELSRRIAYAEGADRGGWDVTQVLRLPGTYNYKHDPPHLIKLLWAYDLVYDPRQVALVYPRLAVTNGHTEAAWPDIDAATIETHLATLPVGIQYMLERDPSGADRSAELLRLAKMLIRQFAVPRGVALHLLERSSLGRSKFGSRSDGRRQLLQMVEDAVTVSPATTSK
jgi:hypothetical protein